jgi:deoxyribose-phosphate aldolase
MSRDALVELITREVLDVVQAKKPAGTRAERAPSDARGGIRTNCGPGFAGLGEAPLLLVCGNPLGARDAVKLFGELRKRFPGLGVVLSKAAIRLFADSRRPFAGYVLDPHDRDHEQRVAGHTSVVVINTSVNLLAKMAHLIADTPATILTFNALKAGRPVVLTTDGLLPWYFNGAVTARIQGYLKDVASYGVQVAPADALLPSAGLPAGGPSAPLPTADTECGTCAWAGHCARLCPDRVSAVHGEGAARVASVLGMDAPPRDIGRMIDHTLLKPDTTEADVRRLCEEARRHNFASVCVNPGWVKLCKTLLAGTRVMVCTVVGFPLGATTSESKAAETHQAVMDGADEIDMVISVGALKAGDHGRVLDDIRAVVRAARGHTVKVILETGLLNDADKKKGCELAVDAGADFVKTSTGFGPGGATVADIELMRRTVGPRIGVKASGGVRDYETARKMVAAGATRIGASASVAIVKGARGEKATGGADPGYGYGGTGTAGASAGAGTGGSAARTAVIANPGPGVKPGS